MSKITNGVRLMGIDYGTKNVGIAISDEDGHVAFPRTVLPNDKNLIGELEKIVSESEVKKIVVGESKDYLGKNNPIMTRIKKFVVELSEVTGLETHLEPEFMTTTQAHRIEGVTDMEDASAASIILQSFIDKQNMSQ